MSNIPTNPSNNNNNNKTSAEKKKKHAGKSAYSSSVESNIPEMAPARSPARKSRLPTTENVETHSDPHRPNHRPRKVPSSVSNENSTGSRQSRPSSADREARSPTRKARLPSSADRNPRSPARKSRHPTSEDMDGISDIPDHRPRRVPSSASNERSTGSRPSSADRHTLHPAPLALSPTVPARSPNAHRPIMRARSSDSNDLPPPAGRPRPLALSPVASAPSLGPQPLRKPSRDRTVSKDRNNKTSCSRSTENRIPSCEDNGNQPSDGKVYFGKGKNFHGFQTGLIDNEMMKIKTDHAVWAGNKEERKHERKYKHGKGRKEKFHDAVMPASQSLNESARLMREIMKKQPKMEDKPLVDNIFRDDGKPVWTYEECPESEMGDKIKAAAGQDKDKMTEMQKETARYMVIDNVKLAEIVWKDINKENGASDQIPPNYYAPVPIPHLDPYGPFADLKVNDNQFSMESVIKNTASSLNVMSAETFNRRQPIPGERPPPRAPGAKTPAPTTTMKKSGITFASDKNKHVSYDVRDPMHSIRKMNLVGPELDAEEVGPN